MQVTDISSLFNWNTKQVFLWVKAVYPSSKPGEPLSEAVVWDAILPSEIAPWHQNQWIHPGPEPSASKAGKRRSSSSSSHYTAKKRAGIIKLGNQKPKYQITDHTGLIANRGNATLEMGWNIQPWVGALTWTNWNDWGMWKGLKGGRTAPFTFPGVPEKKPANMDTAKGGEGNRGKPA